jgi:DNA-binding MarR family transcriptional regulator
MRLVIEQLRVEGKVLKNVDSQDRRSQIVSITPKGRAVLKAGQRARALWIARFLQCGCSSGEMDQVITAIDTLERLLDKAHNSSPKRF